MSGHVITLLDEDLNVLNGEKTGLWFKNRFYQIEDNGHVLVPYSHEELHEQVILVHNNFAKLD